MGIDPNNPAIRQAVKRGLIDKAAVAGPKKNKGRKPPAVVTAAALKWSVTLAIPCRVISESNRRDHWTDERNRQELQNQAFHLAWHASRLAQVVRLPVTVTWVHVGPEVDDDNLRRAFKGLRDKLAEWLGLPDDRDPRVKWAYDQRPGEPGVELKIEGGV